MIASLAERMRDWISENIQADKYDYKSKSGRQQSYKDFFIFHKEHDQELNEKSVRSIHQPTLEKVWAELERDVTEIKNTPRIKATKPAYDSTLNNDPNNKGMTADPKPQKQVIEAGTEPLGGAANNTLVDHSADSVGSFFQWYVGHGTNLLCRVTRHDGGKTTKIRQFIFTIFSDSIFQQKENYLPPVNNVRDFYYDARNSGMSQNTSRK